MTSVSSASLIANPQTTPTLFVDATSAHWTGLSVYINSFLDFVSHDYSASCSLVFIIYKQQYAYFILSGISKNNLYVIDDNPFFYFLPSLFSKSLSFFLYLRSQPPSSAVLLNSQIIILPLRLKLVKVWHASLHLMPNLVAKYLSVAPIRFLRLRLETLLDTLNYSSYDAFIFPSYWSSLLVANSFAISPPKRSAVIPHDLTYLDASIKADTRSSQPPGFLPNFIHIIYNAALDIYKNHDLLIHWFDQCLDLPVNLVLIGPVVIPSVLNQFKSSLSWSKSRVLYLGRLSYCQVHSLYSKVDGAIFFSDTESFCYPLSEAIHFGLPFGFLDNPCNRSICQDQGSPLSSSSDLRRFISALCNDSLTPNHVISVCEPPFFSVRRTIEFSLSSEC